MSLRYRMFRALARLDFEHPWPVLIACAALAVASILYTRARLEFRTGQEDLISADGRDSRNYLRYTSEFPDIDGLVVAVRADTDPARAERFADAFAARLAPDRDDVKSVFYKLDPGMLAGGALLYLSVGDLNELAERVRDYHALPVRVRVRSDAGEFFRAGQRRGESRDAIDDRQRPVRRPCARAGAPPHTTQALDLGFIDAMVHGDARGAGRSRAFAVGSIDQQTRAAACCATATLPPTTANTC